MIITRTPFRVSFFGGGTDYPDWFRDHGGCVLTSTIKYYCYLTCRSLPPFFSHKSRIVWSQIELVEQNNEIQHPLVKGVLKYLNIGEGVEVFHHGDLPARSGLGSSSAFAVGLLHALQALQGKMVSKYELARQAIEVEQVLLKESVGVQDQIQTSFGGINRIDIRTDGSFDVQPIPLTNERVEKFENHLALFYTGISRMASDIAAAQIAAIPKSKYQLATMQNLVNEAEKCLSVPDFVQFGKLLHESWLLKKSLSTRITSSESDDLYEAGMNHGAYGGKLLGAGGGGFMLFVIDPSRRAELIKALDKFLYVPLRFDKSGTRIVHFEENEYYSLSS